MWRIIFILPICVLSLNVYGQYQYSIDKGQLSQSRRLTINEHIENYKQRKKERQKVRKIRREDRKAEQLAKNYQKEKQTKLTQKRMKETRQMAQNFNRGKPAVEFYIYMEYKIKKYYGRFSGNLNLLSGIYYNRHYQRVEGRKER